MATVEIATLAGGCFWGMEDLFRKLPGVLNTDVGYTGGNTSKATYNEVKTGRTMHAEALQIEFDPAQLTYEDLLLFFFRIHDPTTENRQGNDIGTQYRSAIFYHNEEQKKTAERVIARVNNSKAWRDPVATQVTPAAQFHVAEEYHQDYLEKEPNGYTCHYVRRIEY